MKKIYLSGKNSDLFCIVDDEDFEWLNQYRWYLHRKGYAARNKKYINNIPDDQPVKMHVLLLGKKDGFVTDHINNNKLDNRKENLRFLTNTENIRRRGKMNNSTTGYKGVYLLRNPELKKETIRYTSMIRVDKRLKQVGYFKSLYEAVVAYNKASKKYHGEFGYQNPLPSKE